MTSPGSGHRKRPAVGLRTVPRPQPGDHILALHDDPSFVERLVSTYIMEGLRSHAKVAVLIPTEHLAEYMTILENHLMAKEERIEDGAVAFLPSNMVMDMVKRGDGDALSHAAALIEDLCKEASLDGWPQVFILNGMGATAHDDEEIEATYKLESIWFSLREKYAVVTLCLYPGSQLANKGNVGLLIGLTYSHNHFLQPGDIQPRLPEGNT